MAEKDTCGRTVNLVSRVEVLNDFVLLVSSLSRDRIFAILYVEFDENRFEKRFRNNFVLPEKAIVQNPEKI